MNIVTDSDESMMGVGSAITPVSSGTVFSASWLPSVSVVSSVFSSGFTRSPTSSPEFSSSISLPSVGVSVLSCTAVASDAVAFSVPTDSTGAFVSGSTTFSSGVTVPSAGTVASCSTASVVTWVVSAESGLSAYTHTVWSSISMLNRNASIRCQPLFLPVS